MITKGKLLMIISIIVFVNAYIDLLGIYIPLKNEFSISYLSIFMILILVATIIGAGLFLWITRDN